MIEEGVGGNEISSKIKRRFSFDEKLIYILKSSHRDRKPLFLKIIMDIFYIVTFFSLVYFVIELFNIINNRISIFSDSGLMLLMCLGTLIFLVFFVPLIIRNINNCELVLTNRILYVRSTNKYHKEVFFYKIALNSIIAIGYKENFKLIKNKNPLKDLIIIIQDKLNICEKLIIYDVPDIDTIQNKIESVLWYISEKSNRWEQIKIMEKIEIDKIYKWDDKELKYDNSSLMYKEFDKEYCILFKEAINFKFSQKTQQFYILSHPLGSPKIKIGPIDVNKMELIYLIYLNWKNNQKLLSSKKQLLTEKINKIKLSETKENIILKPIDKNNLDLQKINQFLNANEYILIYYKPYYHLRKNLILIYVGIAALIFMIIQMVFLSFGTIIISGVFVIVSIVVCIFLMMSCFFPMLTFSFKKNINKTEYFFTNKKIIIVSPEENIIIEFDNISTVTIDEDKTSNFVIISLIKSIEIGYSEDENEIPIFISPKNKKITEKIYYLLRDNIKTE